MTDTPTRAEILAMDDAAFADAMRRRSEASRKADAIRQAETHAAALVKRYGTPNGDAK